MRRSRIRPPTWSSIAAVDRPLFGFAMLLTRVSCLRPADSPSISIQRSTVISPTGSNPYRRLPSPSAQAEATAEFGGVSVPGIVAQPPFSMIDRRFYDETLLNSINIVARHRSERARRRPPFELALSPSARRCCRASIRMLKTDHRYRSRTSHRLPDA